MEYLANQVYLRGMLSELPQFSHENHGKRFYRLSVEVQRLSGTADVLPVLVPEQVLCDMDPTGGTMLEVAGQIRTFNDRVADRRRLVISVYAESLRSCEGEFCNQVTLTGTLCKAPTCRKTPLGRIICDGMLAVNRPYHRADYIPCIFWGQTAQTIGSCMVGDRLQLTGRLQSRQYVKVLEDRTQTRTAYEVSAMTVELL